MKWNSRFSVSSILPLIYIFNFATSLSIIDRGLDDEKVRYDGHRLYRIRPTTVRESEILRNISDEEGYNLWAYSGGRSSVIDLMVSSEKLNEFEKLLYKNNIAFEELMNNVQRFIDEENPLSGTRDSFGWKSYHDLEGINRWLDTLANEYPNLITPLVAGVSYEGRNIRGVKLSFHHGNPGVFLEGGIHAREWIAPAVVTYMLNELITSNDTIVRNLAESYDWYVFPVFNPDGYVYTHKTNRLWRKTRKPYSARCFGADPNRNWDFHWREKGASTYPCSETFAGSGAFSEKEMKTTSEYITSIKDKFFAYIAFHSYSQVILLPYGFSNAHVNNYDDLMQIGNASAAALAKRYGTSYQVGNIVDVLYPASGGSMDWVRGTCNTPITFTYELRDQGSYGFILPADQIIPSGQETLDSLVAMLQESKKLGYGVLQPDKQT